MLKIDEDRLLNDILLTRNRLVYGVSKEKIKKDYNGMYLLNKVLANSFNKYVIMDKMFLDFNGTVELLEKNHDRVVNDFYTKVSNYGEILVNSFNNFDKITNKYNSTYLPYYGVIKNYSEKDFKEIILSYFSTYGNDIYKIAKKYFDENRIQMAYTTKIDSIDENIGGFFASLSWLDSGYIISLYNKYNTTSLLSICHELGHAIDAERFIFSQKKKIDPFSDPFLEIPSTFFEIGAHYYLINQKIDVFGSKILLNDRYYVIRNSSESMTNIYSSDNVIMQKDGDILIPCRKNYKKEDVIFNSDNSIIINGELLYNYELKDDEVIIDAYLKYPFRDDIIYGLGYYIAFHLNEIRNKDIKDFNRIFNDIITLRKEANLEDLINLLGISKDEFTSCKLIEDRMKEDILSLNKKFNVY